MSEFDDGGPAFTFPVLHGISAPKGMSLRDYFITHAPLEPAEWFEPVMTSVCPEIEAIKPVKRRWWHFMCGPPSAGLILPRYRYSLERYMWNIEYKKQCQIQWPTAWADQMLIQRNKESQQ